MGFPKLLKKYRAFKEAYKVEYSFEGTVEKFDTIDIVDPERLTRGLYVSNENGTRYVPLALGKKPPAEIGDTVIVVGKDGQYKENVVSTAVILIPNGHYAIFSRDIRTRPARVALVWNIPTIVAFIIAIIVYWTRSYEWLFIPAILIFLYWSYIDTYLTNRLKKPKLYSCDEETWQSLLDDATSTFEVTHQESAV